MDIELGFISQHLSTLETAANLLISSLGLYLAYTQRKTRRLLDYQVVSDTTQPISNLRQVIITIRNIGFEDILKDEFDTPLSFDFGPGVHVTNVGIDNSSYVPIILSPPETVEIPSFLWSKGEVHKLEVLIDQQSHPPTEPVAGGKIKSGSIIKRKKFSFRKIINRKVIKNYILPITLFISAVLFIIIVSTLPITLNTI